MNYINKFSQKIITKAQSEMFPKLPTKATD